MAPSSYESVQLNKKLDEVASDDENSENGDGSEGGDGDQEYEEGQEYETTLEEHLTNAEAQKIDARETFFGETVGFSFSDASGDYHARASNESSEVKFFDGYEWPQAYVGEDEDIKDKERYSVNAAIWFKSHENDRYELISLWCFTGRYEATTIFYSKERESFLKPWFEGTPDFLNQFITDPECHINFLSDQSACVTEAFYCPALDFISIDEMETMIEASALDREQQEDEEQGGSEEGSDVDHTNSGNEIDHNGLNVDDEDEEDDDDEDGDESEQQGKRPRTN